MQSVLLCLEILISKVAAILGQGVEECATAIGVDDAQIKALSMLYFGARGTPRICNRGERIPACKIAVPDLVFCFSWGTWGPAVEDSERLHW